MPIQKPRARLLLLKDHEPGASIADDLDALAHDLEELLGSHDVELEAQGNSTVAASVPARNNRERERLKALVNDRLAGWRVIEEQGYRLPTTF